jgi:hypothetical protein
MDLSKLATRHGFSESAATAAVASLRRGNGMAQFDHPELGGHGQWMPGMIMIGRMADDSLKARVSALFTDLVSAVKSEPLKPPVSDFEAPADWGPPSTSGSQNGHRYAWYPRSSRLVVERDGQRTVYDTAAHQITGVAQDQSSDLPSRLVFTSEHGPVPLEKLRRIE